MRLRHRHDGEGSSDVEKPEREGNWRDWTRRRLTGKSPQHVGLRLRNGLSWAVYTILIVVVFLEHTSIVPSPVLRPLIGSGLLFLGYKLYTFPRWGDEHRHLLLFATCFFAMLGELLWENCMVWAVSACDIRKYEHVPGLQDNVEILMGWVIHSSSTARAVLTFQWADIKHLLGAILALAFSVLWDQVPYSGFGIMSRVFVTITLSRLLRVASFMSTVLPNPRPGCYGKRFPPVPDTLLGWLHVGFGTIRGFGGCNDLVFSGHGVIWTLAPLAFQSYYPGKVTWILWLAVTHRSLLDVIDKQHYSVDMVLAVAVTWLVWHAVQWVYPPSDTLPVRPHGTPPDKPNVYVLALILFTLFAAAVIVFVGRA